MRQRVRKIDPAAIADAIVGAVQERRNFEPELYFHAERECLAALKESGPPAKVILFCAAMLADYLAKELEDGAILASAEALWVTYAHELEQLIRLASSPRTPQENMWQMARAISAIYPPQGRPT